MPRLAFLGVSPGVLLTLLVGVLLAATAWIGPRSMAPIPAVAASRAPTSRVDMTPDGIPRSARRGTVDLRLGGTLARPWSVRSPRSHASIPGKRGPG